MKVKNLPQKVLVFSCALTLALNAGAWDGTGHMIVAQIAYNRLNDKAKARVEELASKIQRNGVPYNAVNIACWADDIKTRDSDSPFQNQFKPWHYIDIGCLPTDPDVFSNPPPLTATSGNVVVALEHCVNILKTHKPDELVPNESVALALVMHFVGDIHQPLHTTARYNPNPAPGGHSDDAGGNGVVVTNLVETMWPNLHTFWDEAYRRYYENDEVKALARLSESDAPGSPDLKAWVKRVEPDAPKVSAADLQYDLKKWIMGSHEIACSQVYGTLGEPYGKPTELTEAYVKAGTETARRQLALAGYRLAALLNDLYGK